ncbi:MAG: leucine-rich repeat-containing protein kinase family protein [Burkholderiaceae bacterium]
MSTLEQLRRGELAGARRLDLCGGLEQVPEDVFALADSLEVLNLNGNRLRDLPKDMGRLHRLRVLFCSGNPFEHLPESLGDCGSLEMVGFKSCQIGVVPANALPMPLRWLILTDNRIERLPASLGERPRLQKLMLAGNRLQALPDSLADAQALELLRLSANDLPMLPDWLPRLPKLAWLAVSGNPLGWETTRPTALPLRHWSELRLGTRLGEGASGVIHRVEFVTGDGAHLALKLFRGAVTSDGRPEDELLAHRCVGPHPGLCGPVAEVAGHPEGASGMLLPLLPPDLENLADPPSFETCTRDVYDGSLVLPPGAVGPMALALARVLAHMHRCGVPHGDFYAHNVLWNRQTHRLVLSDLGGATLLPLDRPALARALCSLDVRAWGILVEELLARVAGQDGGDRLDRLRSLVNDCVQADPGRRPAMADVVSALDG